MRPSQKSANQHSVQVDLLYTEATKKNEQQPHITSEWTESHWKSAKKIHHCPELPIWETKHLQIKMYTSKESININYHKTFMTRAIFHLHQMEQIITSSSTHTVQGTRNWGRGDLLSLNCQRKLTLRKKFSRIQKWKWGFALMESKWTSMSIRKMLTGMPKRILKIPRASR